MDLVDHHVHWYPDELNRDPAGWAAANREPHWARLCLRRRRDGLPVQEFPDVDELLRAMDVAGVARAVLLGWYWENPYTCAWHNRAMAAAARSHPDRLEAWATIHPGDAPEAVAVELARARDEGCRGLGELSPHSVGAGMDAPGFAAALDFAERHGWAVNLHVTDPAGRDYPGKVATPAEDFERLAWARPGLRLVLAHWGGGADLREHGNVFVDTAAAPLARGEAAWELAGRTVPAGRVLFGSDYPLRLRPGVSGAEGWAGFVVEARKRGVAEGSPVAFRAGL